MRKWQVGPYLIHSEQSNKNDAPKRAKNVTYLSQIATQWVRGQLFRAERAGTAARRTPKQGTNALTEAPKRGAAKPQ